jgi:hypothetical protein
MWPRKMDRDTWICEHCHRPNHPEADLPDIYVKNPRGPGFPIEVKLYPGDDSAFAFSRITTGQHRWLNNWTLDGGHAFLVLGTRTGKAGSKTNPRRLWLVPWRDWLRVEISCREAGQASLPLENPYRLAMKDADLYAIAALAKWELVWEDGCWHLGECHPLNTLLLGREERDLGEESRRWESVGAAPVDSVTELLTGALSRS